VRTEVYINNLLIDLEDETTVAASYGNISFGELNKRKGVKSTVWKGPFTQRNKLAMESCEVVGSFSLIPYRKNLIRVEIDGVIVFEGFCVVDEANDGYNYQSFSGASDFYSIITSKKLSVLDLSAFSHVWNDVNVKNSWTNVNGYIYAFVEYGKEWPDTGAAAGLPPDAMLPQLYFHSVVKQIATDAGYTLYGEVLTNQRFLKHVIIPNKFPLTIQYGGTWVLNTLFPDLTQSKVWLDFANIYGLQFDINDLTKEIYCSYIDDILFNEAEDWSLKVDKTEKQSTRYKFDYGQTSKLRYKYDAVTEANGCWQDFVKDISIDDTTLDVEKDIYKSEFYLIQDVDPVLFPDGRATTRTFVTKAGKANSGIWNAATAYGGDPGTTVWRNGTYYSSILAGTNKDPATEPTYWKSIAEKDVWEMKSRPMYGTVITDVFSILSVKFGTPAIVTKIVSNTDMEWGYSFDHHYRVFERIIQKTKIVEKLLKLNYADVNQLSFEKGKLVDGELYLLEEVVQFHLNQVGSTICRMVRL
jgi:hypothetical protein